MFNKCKCKRCGYSWYSRLLKGKPILCPHCKSPNWDKNK